VQSEELIPGRIPTEADAAKWKTDVLYWPCHEDENVSIGLFFVRKGGTIPLHNHPGMTVYSKVLFGELETVSFDWVRGKPVGGGGEGGGVVGGGGGGGSGVGGGGRRSAPAHAECKAVGRSEAGAIASLTAEECNLHQIQAIRTCAFLDVITPPYNDDDRDCLYFKPVGGPLPVVVGSRLVLEQSHWEDDISIYTPIEPL
jgi:cysteamine dioxygenase